MRRFPPSTRRNPRSKPSNPSKINDLEPSQVPLPGLTHVGWLNGVQKAIDLRAHSITLYGLEIWPRTVFAHWAKHGTLDLPDRRNEIDMHLAAIELLRTHGYRPGAASGYLADRNRRPYSTYLDISWSCDPVLGFGVGSRSSIAQRGWANTRSLPQYLSTIADHGLAVEKGCLRSATQLMRQHVVRGVKRGYIDPAAFLSRFGMSLDRVFPQQLQEIVSAGLAAERAGLVELTDLGRVLVANVAHAFISADDREVDRRMQVGVAFDGHGGTK